MLLISKDAARPPEVGDDESLYLGDAGRQAATNTDQRSRRESRRIIATLGVERRAQRCQHLTGVLDTNADVVRLNLPGTAIVGTGER
jgi:hypothetical protein